MKRINVKETPHDLSYIFNFIFNKNTTFEVFFIDLLGLDFQNWLINVKLFLLENKRLIKSY